MVKVNNFIAFFTMNGFFLGIVFGLLKLNDPFEMLLAAMLITAIFYILSIASTSFFVKNIPFNPRYRIKKEKYEKGIDTALIELEKREQLIKETYRFVKELEEEEREEMKRDYVQYTQARRRRR